MSTETVAQMSYSTRRPGLIARAMIAIAVAVTALAGGIPMASVGAEAEAIAPNGRIAFTGTGNALDVLTIDPDGTDSRPLVNSHSNDTKPAWSPDGSRIAYAVPGPGFVDIWVADRHGQGAVKLTGSASTNTDPAWSPDGSRIAFSSDRSGSVEIWVMNADGTAPARLTNHAAPDQEPTWSPDGAFIAFTSQRHDGGEIYRMRPDGSGLQRLTLATASQDKEPAWSPDGGRIAFASNRDGDFEVYVMDQFGGSVQALTNHGAEDRAPAWSPDGTRLAFATMRHGHSDIYTVAATGGVEQRVTTTVGNEFDPSWAPVCRHSFADVGAWVTAAVDWGYCNDHMTGYPDGTFGPDQAISRAQVARLLYRVAGSPDVSGLPAHGLSDVPAWVSDPVRWLVASQHMTGYPDGSFKPNLPITRGQVTRATFRIAGQPGGSPHPFSDVPAWLIDAVNWVAHDPDGAGPATSLMDGYPDGTFRDELDISRAQTIRLTCRINAAPGTC